MLTDRETLANYTRIRCSALKVVDPICSLKMWDWIKNNGNVKVNTTQKLSLKIENWKLTLGWLIIE